MAITLYETFRAVFYAPFYAALARGAFADEGLEVELRTAESLAVTAAGALGADADVSWGGPMRLLYAHDRDPASPLAGFCEVVTRDPFFIVGKTGIDGLAGLAGKRLGAVSEVPTPLLCLRQDLREAGIDVRAIALETGRTIAENVAAFRAGALDAIQVPEPWATLLTATGDARIVEAAAARGACSYTTLFTSRETIAARRDEMLAMTRAIFRTQTWLHGAEPAEAAAAIGPYFSDIDTGVLANAVTRYRSLGVWGKTPLLDPAGFDWLRKACLGGGLIARGASYEDCIDASVAHDAMQAIQGEETPS